MKKVLSTGNGREGQSLVEIMIGLSLIVLGIGFASILVFGGEKILIDRGNAIQARQIAKAGLEAARSIRERDWNELADGVHGLAFGTSSWFFSGSADSDGFFTRTVTVSPSGENAKLVESKVSWNPDPLRTLSVKFTTLVTNWENATPPPDPGDTGGGGISGDWRNPRTLGAVDLGPGNSATDLDVINKIIYMTAEASSQNKPDFFIINATNGQNPIIVSNLAIPGVSGLAALDVSGIYAFVIENNLPRIRIVDVSSITAPSLVQSYDLPEATGDGMSVFYSGSRIFAGTETSQNSDEFYIIDVSNPIVPTYLGSFNVNADVNKIYVSGKTAYLATSADSGEMVVLDISNPANIVELGRFNATGSADGKSIFLSSSKQYLGRLSSSNRELQILDATDPANILNVGFADLGGDLNDMYVRETLAFVGTSDSNNEFQVWDVSDPSVPTFWSSFNFPQVATGLDYEDNIVYVSVRSNDALRIITSSP
ncbi:MAG TPA: hypothetical protein VNK70_02620 [Candidatus Paceibacterota bacterium]|nr:hypothetical protein [Candidatus Paceibacterota bacterium]